MDSRNGCHDGGRTPRRWRRLGLFPLLARRCLSPSPDESSEPIMRKTRLVLQGGSEPAAGAEAAEEDEGGAAGALAAEAGALAAVAGALGAGAGAEATSGRSSSPSASAAEVSSSALPAAVLLDAAPATAVQLRAKDSTKLIFFTLRPKASSGDPPSKTSTAARSVSAGTRNPARSSASGTSQVLSSPVTPSGKFALGTR